MGVSSAPWGKWLQYGLPGLVTGLALSWGLGRSTEAQVHADTRTAVRGEGNGTIAFTSSAANGSQLLYLIDTHAQAFAVYQVDPAKGTVKLDAVRPYQWDLKLEGGFNNLAPEVEAVQAMVSPSSRK